jgi:NIPSNAP
MVYELRIYECVPGRLPALHERFRNVTRRMFEKHQITVVAYWEDVVGETNRLLYLVRWESMAQRETRWDAFATDPEWIAARTKSEESGPIVARVRNTFMRPTDYSPLP